MAPATEFTFGLVVSNPNAMPPAFSHFATQYNIPQFQAALGASGPPVDNTFTLGSHQLLFDRSLVVLRFFLGKIVFSYIHVLKNFLHFMKNFLH